MDGGGDWIEAAEAAAACNDEKKWRRADERGRFLGGRSWSDSLAAEGSGSAPSTPAARLRRRLLLLFRYCGAGVYSVFSVAGFVRRWCVHLIFERVWAGAAEVRTGALVHDGRDVGCVQEVLPKILGDMELWVLIRMHGREKP
jgi:hypothetical protein